MKFLKMSRTLHHNDSQLVKKHIRTAGLEKKTQNFRLFLRGSDFLLAIFCMEEKTLYLHIKGRFRRETFN